MLGIHFCTPRGSLSREFVIVRFLSLFLLARTVLTSSKEHVHIKDGFLLSQHTSIEFPEQLELHRATSDLLTSNPEEKFASMKLRTEKISEPDLFWRHYAHHLGVLPEDMRPHLHANRIPSVRINPYSKVEYKTYQQYLNGRCQTSFDGNRLVLFHNSFFLQGQIIVYVKWNLMVKEI